MQYAEAVSVIRRVSMFAGLDPTTQKLLAFASDYHLFHAGEVLFHEGDPTDSVYLIDEGAVEVVVAREGSELVIGRLGKHQLVGEMGIFRKAPRSATIRALEEVKVLKIAGEVFLQAVTGNADAALAIMKILSERLAVMTDRYEQVKRELTVRGDWPNPP